MTNIYVYIGLLALAMLVVRVNLVESRGMDYRADRDLHGATLGFLAMLATFALIAYGFIHLRWYWSVIALAAGVALQMLVTRSSFWTFRAMRIPLELVAIGGAVAVWFI